MPKIIPDKMKRYLADKQKKLKGAEVAEQLALSAVRDLKKEIKALEQKASVKTQIQPNCWYRVAIENDSLPTGAFLFITEVKVGKRYVHVKYVLCEWSEYQITVIVKTDGGEELLKEVKVFMVSRQNASLEWPDVLCVEPISELELVTGYNFIGEQVIRVAPKNSEAVYLANHNGVLREISAIIVRNNEDMKNALEECFD